MWNWKKEEKTVRTYGGNFCPPAPPRATDQELADSADEFTDTVEQAMKLLDKAMKLVLSYDVEAVENPNERWADHYPRFPFSGRELYDNLVTAQARLIEANRTVAVQGYSAKRRLEEKENDD
jgi:hypothetical protein